MHFLSFPNNKIAQLVGIIPGGWQGTFVQNSQCHDCWWPGDASSQDISIPGIDPVFLEDSSFSTSNVKYRQVFNIRRTLEGNKIVDHSDVVGASPVGAAPTTSSFST